MNQQFEDLAKKTAEYIAATQPALDRMDNLSTKVASFEKKACSFVERATLSANRLASHGFIEHSDINTFIDKVAEDPSSIWDFVEKIASASSNEFGASTSEKIANNASDDPFIREFFGISNTNTGMID